jgi:hypothetical protein
VALAGLAGCGGHGKRTTGMAQPKLPRAVARDLARRSELVAVRLEAGDPCGALAAAKDLQLQTIAAVNRREVPGPLQEPLGAAAASLTVRIHCAVPIERHDNGKHEGELKHGKHDNQGQGGD